LIVVVVVAVFLFVGSASVLFFRLLWVVVAVCRVWLDQTDWTDGRCDDVLDCMEANLC